MNTVPSKSAVKKAGSSMRKYSRGEIGKEEYQAQLQVIDRYRATFLEPVKEFRTHLVRLLDAAGIQAETTWRLKRLPTIEQKLVREPTLNLALMQDIGGCRSVVSSIDVLYEMQELVQSYWECKPSDYVSSPRESGYRALHLVVDTGEGKAVELQIRTTAMHKWAETVEAFSGVFGENYKQDGDHVVQQFTHALSELYEAEEKGVTPSPESFAKLNKLTPRIAELVKSKTMVR